MVCKQVLNSAKQLLFISESDVRKILARPAKGQQKWPPSWKCSATGLLHPQEGALLTLIEITQIIPKKTASWSETHWKELNGKHHKPIF